MAFTLCFCFGIVLGRTFKGVNYECKKDDRRAKEVAGADNKT